MERNPEAEERLRARDPDRLAMLDQMRDQDCKARGLKKQAPPFGQLPRSALSRAVPVQPRARIPPAPPRHPSARAATVPTRTTPAARRKVALAAMADEKTAMEARLREVEGQMQALHEDDERDEDEEDPRPATRRFSMCAITKRGEEQDNDKFALMSEKYDVPYMAAADERDDDRPARDPPDSLLDRTMVLWLNTRRDRKSLNKRIVEVAELRRAFTDWQNQTLRRRWVCNSATRERDRNSWYLHHASPHVHVLHGCPPHFANSILLREASHCTSSPDRNRLAVLTANAAQRSQRRSGERV